MLTDNSTMQVGDILVDKYNPKRTFRLLALPTGLLGTSVGLALMQFVKLNEQGEIIYEGKENGYNQIHLFKKYKQPYILREHPLSLLVIGIKNLFKNKLHEHR